MRLLLGLVVLVPLMATAAGTPDPAPADAPPLRFEGAIGLVSSYAPEYGGARRSAWRFRPGGFLRYGRLTLSGSGGFTTRRDSDVERGVSAALVEHETLRVSLSARWTHGRQASDSGALAGMGDVPGTVLARLRVHWLPEGPWRYALAVNTDLLGHGHGYTVELGASRAWTLDAQTRLLFSAAASAGSDTHLQSWYGVTAAQAERSGLPVYTPGNGLRDLSADLTLRHEFGPHWGSFVGTGVSWQVGAAAQSPLVRRRLGWTVGCGLVWRF